MSALSERVDFQYHQELGGLEMIDAQYQHKNFGKHCHESYTVSVIKSGVQKFYRSGGEHFAPEHSIILVNADDVHTGQAADGIGWSYQAIYPLEAHFNELARSIGWKGSFAPYFPSAVVHDPELAKQLHYFFDCLQFKDNLLEKEALLSSVLTTLMVRYGTERKTIVEAGSNHSAILRAKDYLCDNVTEKVSLKELANEVGVSAFHLTRQFQKAFGLPPHAYQIQQRLKLGKQLLKQGIKVIETSSEIGFHDQSHFHRHFKKSMGVSPGCYAKAVVG